MARGKGWHGDPEGHLKAGKKGGASTSAKHDHEFYSKIGQKGGRKSPGNFKNDPEKASRAGKIGGSR